MGTRRRFTKEYKQESVQLVTQRGVTVAQAARDLGLNPNVLRKWVREQKADPAHAFPGEGQQKPEQAELTRLRREVAKLKMERDILKKAAVGSMGDCNGSDLTILPECPEWRSSVDLDCPRSRRKTYGSDGSRASRSARSAERLGKRRVLSTASLRRTAVSHRRLVLEHAGP